jgi:hypothetical protein
MVNITWRWELEFKALNFCCSRIFFGLAGALRRFVVVMALVPDLSERP